MFDLFRHHFFFRIGKTSSHSTRFSVCISIFICIPLSILFLFLVIGVFERTTTHINVQEMDIIKRPQITLNANNYRMGLKFQTKSGLILDPSEISSYFDVKAKYIVINNTATGQFIEEERDYEFKTCQKSDFIDFEDYYEINLRKAICISNHSFNLEGYWDESKVSYGNIQLRLCNQSLNPLCKNKEEIWNMFQGGYIYILSETQNINSLIYENPVILTMKTSRFLIDTTTRNDVSFYLQKIIFSSYDGLIYNKDAIVSDFYKQTFYTSNTLNIALNNETLIWNCDFLSSTKLLTIERYYTTLIEIFGILGGISKFFIMIGIFLTAKYNEQVLFCKILNQLYYFDTNETGIKDNKNIEMKENKESNISYFSKTPEQGFSIFSYSNEKDNSPVAQIKSNIILKESLDQPKSNCEINAQEIHNTIDIKNFEENILQKKTKNLLKNPELIDRQFLGSQQNMVLLPVNDNKLLSKKFGQNLQTQNESKIINSEQIYIETSKEKEVLSFSTSETIMSFFFPSFMSKETKAKIALLEEGKNNLLKYIDIYQIVKQFQELENLKMVLLNKRQLAVFNHISRPIISSKTNSENNNSYFRSASKVTTLIKEYCTKKKRILESDIFETIKASDQGNEIDCRLLELLNDEIKEKIINNFKIK